MNDTIGIAVQKSIEITMITSAQKTPASRKRNAEKMVESWKKKKLEHEAMVERVRVLETEVETWRQRCLVGMGRFIVV